MTLSFTLAGAEQLFLWAPSSPSLYTANVTIQAGGYSDTLSVRFGVRSVSVSASTGLLLNGVPTKLYGGCVHHANGPLGARAIDRAEERRVELLKGIGYNAIRTSHNPVSAAFLDACDRLGVLVMEETFDCWSIAKHNQDYHLYVDCRRFRFRFRTRIATCSAHRRAERRPQFVPVLAHVCHHCRRRYFKQWWKRDTAAMVLRDRSRPSVIMWSIGNEIPDRWTDAVANDSVALRDYVHALDPGSGRAVTSAYVECRRFRTRIATCFP